MAETELKPHEPFLREITLRNILSFGPDTPPFELKNLNVLIGPNGSGKSNFIDCIDLLRSTATDILRAFREGGGAAEWIRKGTGQSPRAFVSATTSLLGLSSFAHSFTFDHQFGRFRIVEESISRVNPLGQIDPQLMAHAAGGKLLYPPARENGVVSLGGVAHSAPQGPSYSDSASLLQDLFWETGWEAKFLSTLYQHVRIYNRWVQGRTAPSRLPQLADNVPRPLIEDGSNLALCLNDLSQNVQTKRAIRKHLNSLYEGLTDINVRVVQGTLQAVVEEGDQMISAIRLSDGTIRLLSLLAILCDPEPPPLICLEEPEVGLHPDLIGKVAALLVDASTRTQLVVTTHSDILIDALSDHADSVVVCEKVDGATTMTRLDAERLAPWLERYRLGQLWTKGELGGTRW